MWDGINDMRETPLNDNPVKDFKHNQSTKLTSAQNLKAYHSLIGLMLSSQTRGVVSGATTRYLIDEKNLSIKTILKTKESDLAEWINKCCFYNLKAKYIKQTTQILDE